MIEFYCLKTGKVLTNTVDYLFVMNNKVYANNEKTCESQCAVVRFDDFITERPKIGWRCVAA